MRLVRRSFCLMIVFFICITTVFQLPISVAANDTTNSEMVPDGTFIENAYQSLTDFESKTNGQSVTLNDTTVTLNKGDGDHFALLKEDKMYKSFIYEADVKFMEGEDLGRAAGLALFRNRDNLTDSAWFAGNVAPYANENRARFFRVSNEVTNFPINDIADSDLTGVNHLSITMQENGNFIYKIKTANGIEKEVSGTIADWYGAYLGLITFKTKAEFSNVRVKDLSPQVPTYFKSEIQSIADNNQDNAIPVNNTLYKSFTFEADAKVVEGSEGSAALMLAKNNSNLLDSWTGVNFHKAANVVKVFGNLENGDVILDRRTEAGFDFDKTIHLSITVNETGELSMKVTDFDGTISEATAKINNWQGAYLGLLSFKSNVQFSNVSIIDHSLNGNSAFSSNLDTLQVKTGTWGIHKNGLYGSINEGDAILLSNTSVKDFVYEADVKFNEKRGAASLVLRSDNDDVSNPNMYVANINGENGEARVFKFEKGNVIDMAKSVHVPLNDKGEYHLKVTMIGKHIVYYINGQLVINTADYTVNNGFAPEINAHYGQNDAILTGKLGLMTWNGNVSYQNVNYQAINDTNTPQLSNIQIGNTASEIDKQISFMKGQYVYIAYVKNSVENVKLEVEKTAGSSIIATNANGEEVDIANLPVALGKNVYTLTVANGNAKVVYKIQLHRMQPDDTYYNEDYRGQYHYSVKDGWANDPNGMVYFNGKYHLFYQFYNDITWGPMHWAHATSTDLIHWSEEPIALYPDEYGSMYSGCAVVADHLTAPDVFAQGEEGIVLLITANGLNGSDGQRVIMAYSKDGETWHKKEDAKVLLDYTEDNSDVLPEHKSAFRDPKVFRYDNQWFMVIAGGPLRIYSSTDLINWELESAYRDLHTECPDLYPLQSDTGEVKWVLDRGGRFYKVGDFREVNGKYRFIPDDNYVAPWYKDSDPNPENRETNYKGDASYEQGKLIDGVMNFGRDYYAAMTYYTSDFGTSQNVKTPRLIAINWMNTWDDYCRDVARKTNNDVFNGTFNLQVELSLTKENDKYLLVQSPIAEYESLRDNSKKIVKENVSVTPNNTLFDDFHMSSYEVIANIKPEVGTKEVGFNVRVGNGQKTEVKYNFETETISIDRSQSGIILSDKFATIDSQNNVVKNEDGSIDLHLYVDRASVEVYTKQNTVSGAVQIFPDAISDGLEVFANGGNAQANISIYPLKTIWKNKANPTTPTNIGVSKSELRVYKGSSEEISAWVTPIEVNQEITARSSDESVASVRVQENKVIISGVNKGEAKIQIASKADASIYKEVKVRVSENLFVSNVGAMSANSGNWYIDDTYYYGSHHDNAFLLTDEKLVDKNFVYSTDLSYTNGIINFIFNAKTKNVYEGCYAVQIKDNNELRLFDFKNDHTFISVNNLERPSDNKYNIQITKKDNTIKVVINGREYINYTVNDQERMYQGGYAGFGIYNANQVGFENFIIRNEDFDALQKLVDESVDYVATDYTKDSYDAYIALINEAKTLLANGNTTSKQAKSKIEKIENSIDDLISLKALRNLITTYEAMDTSKYTEASKQALILKIVEAKNLLTKTDASEQQIKDMIDALKTLKALLVIKEEQTLTTLEDKVLVIGQFAENVIVKALEIKGDAFNEILANVMDLSELDNKVIATIFDISLTHNNIEYMPNGNLLIKIKLDPNVLDKEGLQIIYITDDYRIEFINSYIEGKYICFEIPHLSKYGVIYNDTDRNNAVDKTKDVATGDHTSIGVLWLLMLLSASYILKRKKIN